MVREDKKNSPDKGEEEETAYVSRYELGVEYKQREGRICPPNTDHHEGEVVGDGEHGHVRGEVMAKYVLKNLPVLLLYQL